MERPEAGNGAGDHVRDDPFHGVNLHEAALDAPQIIDLRADPIGLQRHRAGVARVDFTCGSERHAPRPALEKLHADFVLDVLDLPAEGGSRDVEALARFTDRPAAGDLQKIPDLNQRHVFDARECG